MSVSKSRVISFGFILCAIITGCGGAVSDENMTENSSLVQKLMSVEEQASETLSEKVTLVESDTEEVIEAMTEQSTPKEIIEDTLTIAEKTASDTPIAMIKNQLEWQPTGFYENGAVMSMDEISHYQIVFGTSENNLSETITLDIAGLLVHDFTAAANNTWFVGIKTVSIYGGVSKASNIVQFNI